MPQPPEASDAFLNGQGVPVSPGDVEAELARLWGPSAERVGGPDLEHPNVTRVSLANLVVAALDGDTSRIESALDTVVARRPCRAIVLRRNDDPSRRVAAEVSALCHLPAPGLPQVCSERILLGAGPGALDLLPGTVFGLLEPDLPVIVWWADDPRPALEVFRKLASEASRLLLDLPDPAPDVDALRVALDPASCRHSRDLAWFGIHRWRELVAQFFDPPGAQEALRRIASVEVHAASPAADGPPRVAAWLVAWLAGQLGWTPLRRASPGPGRVEATFRTPSGEAVASLTAEVDPALIVPQVRRVEITAPGPDGDESFGLSRLPGDAEQVRIDTSSYNRCALPRLVHGPELDTAHRVAAALESARLDEPYDRARPLLMWLLGA